jgi:hypothetical protein
MFGFFVAESEAGQMLCREKPCGGGGLPATLALLGNGFAGLGEVKTAHRTDPDIHTFTLHVSIGQFRIVRFLYGDL